MEFAEETKYKQIGSKDVISFLESGQQGFILASLLLITDIVVLNTAIEQQGTEKNGIYFDAMMWNFEDYNYIIVNSHSAQAHK